MEMSSGDPVKATKDTHASARNRHPFGCRPGGRPGQALSPCGLGPEPGRPQR